MNAITLGNPNLFVKGMVEAVICDPDSGNIIGYDNVSSESAVTTSVNMGEISGGFGNPLLINIPDTTRISGNLTSQAFSLKQRALASGGEITMGGTIPYCETITAVNGTLTVTKQPALAYGQASTDTVGWCYVRPHGSQTYQGTNYGVNLLTKVVDFSANGSDIYDVFYFINSNAAEVLALPSSFSPSVATIRLKYGVYAKQNNSVSSGTLQGYLYFIVPRAQFVGEAGVGANQTSNSTTDYSWTALMPDSTMMECIQCGDRTADYAYYIYCPCDLSSARIVSLGVIGGNNISFPKGGSARINLIATYDNGYTGVPVYSELTFTSSNPDFDITANGVVDCDAPIGTTSTAIITVSTGVTGGISITVNATATA